MKNFYTLLYFQGYKEEVISRSFEIEHIAKLIKNLPNWKKQHITIFTSNNRDVTKWAIMKSKVVKGD